MYNAVTLGKPSVHVFVFVCLSVCKSTSDIVTYNDNTLWGIENVDCWSVILRSYLDSSVSPTHTCTLGHHTQHTRHTATCPTHTRPHSAISWQHTQRTLFINIINSHQSSQVQLTERLLTHSKHTKNKEIYTSDKTLMWHSNKQQQQTNTIKSHKQPWIDSRHIANTTAHSRKCSDDGFTAWHTHPTSAFTYQMNEWMNDVFINVW